MPNYFILLFFIFYNLSSTKAQDRDCGLNFGTSKNKVDVFKEGKKWYFINEANNKIDENTYDSIALQHKNYFTVKQKKKYALFNSSGLRLTAFKYKKIEDASLTGLNTAYYFVGTISKNNKVGLNCKGLEVATIANTNHAGYVCPGGIMAMANFHVSKDSFGVLVLHPFNWQRDLYKDTTQTYHRFQEFQDNYNGTAFAKANNKWTLVDKNLNKKNTQIFDSIASMEIWESSSVKYRTLVFNQNGCGYVDTYGNLLIEPKYKNLQMLHYGYLWATTFNNKQGWLRLSDKKELFE